jgi:hypothetical protein
MSQTLPLLEQNSVILNGAGNGAIIFQPQYTDQKWMPTGVSCQTTTNVKEPIFKIYHGKSAGAALLDGTYTGSNDSTQIQNIIIYPGDGVYCAWTGGDAGAVASATISGTMEIP